MAKPTRGDHVIDREALAVLDQMFAVSQHLPVGGIQDDLAFEQAKALASFIVAHRGQIPTRELAKVLAAGGVLVEISMRLAVRS